MSTPAATWEVEGAGRHPAPFQRANPRQTHGYRRLV